MPDKRTSSSLTCFRNALSQQQCVCIYYLQNSKDMCFLIIIFDILKQVNLRCDVYSISIFTSSFNHNCVRSLCTQLTWSLWKLALDTLTVSFPSPDELYVISVTISASFPLHNARQFSISALRVYLNTITSVMKSYLVTCFCWKF